MANAEHEAGGAVEGVTDIHAGIQQLGPADAVMVNPLRISEIVGKEV